MSQDSPKDAEFLEAPYGVVDVSCLHSLHAELLVMIVSTLSFQSDVLGRMSCTPQGDEVRQPGAVAW